MLLFVYALYRRDPVFIPGQGFGVFVYLRNLYFVLREQKAGRGGVVCLQPISGGGRFVTHPVASS